MHADNWVQLLTEPALITDLFDSPPDLSRCDLFYVHIDERGDSATLGFNTSHLPSNPIPEWRAKDFNSFEFHLEFGGISELRVSGWAAPVENTARMFGGEDGLVKFSASGPGSSIEFIAHHARIAHMRVGLVSTAP